MNRAQSKAQLCRVGAALLLLGAASALPGCRHNETEEPAFPERVETQCRTREGCQQLFGQLTAKRDYCFREYGPDERPPDCSANDLHWWALKDHIELIELRAQRHADACADQAQRIAQERDKLARDRQRWNQERERAARIDKQWQELAPRRCALEGDEDACYQLVQFVALGPSPYLDEAKAALTAGQRVIDERKRRGGSPKR